MTSLPNSAGCSAKPLHNPPTFTPEKRQPTNIDNAVKGAIQGAAVGAALGGPQGAVVRAVAGFISGGAKAPLVD